ncbi:3(2),5-bisphosphate nucleotidase HAL2 [Gonapodya prolifera JEL478]|uniref:3'(2'),5'-bisphosphate nucleotidase n=1 Tax=Gonapodya prolifera (strain JEL478) TaxID=1344416 RepID=A0A139A9Z1_GONPJ|nr:3(2),5-bisphosphate nucleotidase HAL2 [Gonapodya prolifera JEL478]|eukprot:KXS13233.1 3(2),5-bisphosphate nucleotidase HAL2 [Gonapodya prolifera JEL478]
MSRSPGIPGRTTSRAIRSKSTTGIGPPSSCGSETSIFDTVDFPVAIPPCQMRTLVWTVLPHLNRLTLLASHPPLRHPFRPIITMSYAKERDVAINAVLRASRLCQGVFQHLVAGQTLTKKDKSPVTIADYGSQAVVNVVLGQHFPEDPIVGEEDAADLRVESGRTMKEKVVELANSVFEEKLGEDELLAAIDRGNYAGGAKGRHWTLDPIDGTKGFLRGEQFAVCLALIVDGVVTVGVMGCPNLPVSFSKPDGERGVLFVAVKGEGAFQRAFSATSESLIHVDANPDTSEALFCESVEAEHSAHGDTAKIAEILGMHKAPVRMDSQCKYGTVARGDASIYLRVPTRKDYVEKIWDHAAGALIVTEAGGVISDVLGNPLDFSRGRTLSANKGIVVANQHIHAKVMEAVKTALKGNPNL